MGDRTGWQPLSVDDVRRTQLEILAGIDAFCRSRDLEYYLYAGTLLGAIRHQGFIPWDDDVDVMMPRGDYERFLREFSGSDDLYVVHRGSHRAFPHAYAKVCRSGTLVEEQTRVALPIGVNVDVFPVDPLPAADVLYRLQRGLFQAARALLLAKSLDDRAGRSRAKQAALALGRLVMRPISLHLLTGLRERIATSSARSRSHVGMLVTDVAWRVPTSDLRPARQAVFEGTPRPIPAGTEALLTRIYGDYLTPPPRAAQVKPHAERSFRQTAVPTDDVDGARRRETPDD